MTLLLGMLLLLPVQNAIGDPTVSNVVNFNKGDCGLTVEDPHISNSLLKKKIRAVKINLTSTCTYPQDKVTVTVTLYRKGFFGWVALPTKYATIDKPRPSPYKVEFKKIYFECKSEKKTNYWVKASAVAIIAGEVHKSPEIYSENTTYLKCGV